MLAINLSCGIGKRKEGGAKNHFCLLRRSMKEEKKFVENELDFKDFFFLSISSTLWPKGIYNYLVKPLLGKWQGSYLSHINWHRFWHRRQHKHGAQHLDSETIGIKIDIDINFNITDIGIDRNHRKSSVTSLNSTLTSLTPMTSTLTSTSKPPHWHWHHCMWVNDINSVSVTSTVRQ